MLENTRFSERRFQRLNLVSPHSYMPSFSMNSQLTERLNKTLASQRRNDEELKDMRDKNDQVAHWEAQIAEIIQWYVGMLYIFFKIYIAQVVFLSVINIKLLIKELKVRFSWLNYLLP